jgi:hypothetical protein
MKKSVVAIAIVLLSVEAGAAATETCGVANAISSVSQNCSRVMWALNATKKL